jgi:hypothetical protein
LYYFLKGNSTVPFAKEHPGNSSSDSVDQASKRRFELSKPPLKVSVAGSSSGTTGRGTGLHQLPRTIVFSSSSTNLLMGATAAANGTAAAAEADELEGGWGSGGGDIVNGLGIAAQPAAHFHQPDNMWKVNTETIFVDPQ